MGENLKTKAYNHIRQNLLMGQWPEGAFFSTGKIARNMGMSYTPVREAMIQLESEGLVETVTNQGVRTKMLNREELQEKFELRIILESGASRLAAEKITEEELNELRKLIQQHRYYLREFRNEYAAGTYKSPVLSETGGREIYQINVYLHLGIMRASRNPQLIKLIGDLHILTRVLRTRAALPSEHHLRQMLRDYYFHRRVVRALEKRDSQAVSYWMERHIRDAMRHHLSVLDYLERLHSREQLRAIEIPEFWLKPVVKAENELSEDEKP